jgi:hypothetical protein
MKLTIISILLVTFSTVTAQVTGRLIDASTGESVMNALIIFGDSRSYSGANGTFSAGVSKYILIYTDGYRENSRYQCNSILINYNHTIGERLTDTLQIPGSLIKVQIPSSNNSATLYKFFKS